MKHRATNPFRGFTLVEMLVVISIIVLMVSLSAPAIIGFRQQRELKGAAQVVKSSFIRARSVAIAKRKKVTLFIAGDPATPFSFDLGGGLQVPLARPQGTIHIFFIDQPTGGQPAQLMQVGQPEALPESTSFEFPADHASYDVMPDGRIVLTNDSDDDPEIEDNTDLVVRQDGTTLKCYMDIVANTGRVSFAIR